MNELTYGIAIYVEDSGKTYHTLNDWDLALGNNNYIGDPEMPSDLHKFSARNDHFIPLSQGMEDQQDRGDVIAREPRRGDPANGQQGIRAFLVPGGYK